MAEMFYELSEEHNVTSNWEVHEHNLGGSEWMKNNPISTAIYLFVSGTACVLGTLGNILVLCAIFLHRQLRNTRNTFLVNLAIADLFMTTTAHPFGIIGKYVCYYIKIINSLLRPKNKMSKANKGKGRMCNIFEEL